MVLLRLWDTSFAQVILAMLCGSIWISSISDFNYTIPGHSKLVTAAHGSMSRNDYLLTLSVLSPFSEEGIQTTPVAFDFGDPEFELYIMEITEAIPPNAEEMALMLAGEDTWLASMEEKHLVPHLLGWEDDGNI